MNFLSRILNFLIILKIYYWFSMKPLLKGIFLFSKKIFFNGHYYWASQTCKYLKINFVELKGSQGFQDKKTMVFANHKSQADFFIHNHVLFYQANFLARYAVAVLIPFFLSAYETVWFFNRDKKSDPEVFNKWLDQKFAKSPRKSLVAYIEGHRMTGSESVDKDKLKTGMIRYAYRRKVQCQFLMTFGNEKIFNEKKLSVSFGQSAYYKLSPIIDPGKFGSENDFVAHIKDRFTDFFDQTFKEYQQKVNEQSIKKTA